MDRDLGYEELLALAQELNEKADSFATEADQSQADGMSSYLQAQENSLEQARFLADSAHNELIEATQIAVKNADHRAVVELLETYGRFGIKEA